MQDNYTKICFEIARQDKEKQNAIMEALKTELTEEEYKAVLVGVSYCRLQLYPELKLAMMTALSEELYKEFNKGAKKHEN